MTRVAVTGLSGVIGQKLAPLLDVPTIKLIELYHARPRTLFAAEAYQLDLSSPEHMPAVLKKIKADVIVHLAAITHIDACEVDKKNGHQGVVWKTNVEATRQLVEFCQRTNTKLIFLSTECVFDGTHQSYNETAKPNPKNWYGETKAEAEKLVLSLGKNGTVLRAAIAYHADDKAQTMYGKLLSSFKHNQPFSVVSDQYMTPTLTTDIVRAIMISVEKQLAGVLHVSSNQELTPYEFSQLVAKALKIDAGLAKPVSMEKYFGKAKAALRLKYACLDGTRSQKLLSFKPQTVPEFLS